MAATIQLDTTSSLRILSHIEVARLRWVGLQRINSNEMVKKIMEKLPL